MKYKVSLLPERNRKRINSKKKAEKVKVVSLVALMIVFSLLLVVLASKFFVDKKLAEAKRANAEYEQKVEGLKQYREINNTLQAKVELIGKIQVEEPALYNFLALISNVEHTDVSVTSIDCVEWKTARICTLTGTVKSRVAYLEYIDKLNEIEGVESATSSSYVPTIVDGEATYDFTIVVKCTGGAAIIETEASTEAGETTAEGEAAEETTIAE